MIYASIKGFGPGKYVDAKAYEPIAQAMGGSMSTTGWEEGPPTRHRRADRRLRHGHSHGRCDSCRALSARRAYRRRATRRMHDARFGAQSLPREDARPAALAHGPLREYPNKPSTVSCHVRATHRGAANPGAALRCAPGGPNDYVYLIIQPQIWEPLCKEMGRPELVTDAKYATPEARVPISMRCFASSRQWTQQFGKVRSPRALQCARRAVRAGARHERVARRRVAACSRHGRCRRTSGARHSITRSAVRSAFPIHRSSTAGRHSSASTTKNS